MSFFYTYCRAIYEAIRHHSVSITYEDLIYRYGLRVNQHLLLEPEIIEIIKVCQNIGIEVQEPEPLSVLEELLSKDLRELSKIIQPYWYLPDSENIIVLNLLFPPSYLREHASDYPPLSPALSEPGKDCTYPFPTREVLIPRAAGRGRGSRWEKVPVIDLDTFVEQPKPLELLPSEQEPHFEHHPPRVFLRVFPLKPDSRLIPDTELLRSHLLPILRKHHVRLYIPREEEGLENLWKAYELHREGKSVYQIAKVLFPQSDTAAVADRTSHVSKLIKHAKDWLSTVAEVNL